MRDDAEYQDYQDEEDARRKPAVPVYAPPVDDGNVAPPQTPVPGPNTPNDAVYTPPGQKMPDAPPATPAVAAVAPSQAGQWAATNQGFLDWANKTYGQDAVRGNSFVNAK